MAYRPRLYRPATFFNLTPKHIIHTEAQTLEEACDLLAKEQHHKKRVASRKKRKLTLREVFGTVKGYNAMKVAKAKLAKSRPKPTPHPFHDLTDEQKRVKATEMYMSGLWGIGTPAARKLAACYAVSIGQMTIWLEGLTPPL
jgi:hypothetical protein